MSTRPHPSPQCLLFMRFFNCVTLQWSADTLANIQSWTLYTTVYAGAASSQVDTPLFVSNFFPSTSATHTGMLALRMFFQLCFSYCNAALSIAIHISSTKWYMASDRNVLIKWEGHCIVSRTVGVRERLCVSVARIWSRTSTYLPLCIQHSWEKAKWKSQIVKDTFNVLSFQQINRCFWLDSPCSGSRLPTTGRDLSCSSTRSSPWRTCGWSLIITQNTI